MDSSQLSETELDALRECGNVGIGNAATSLSKMINKQVDINIPETKFMPLSKLSYDLGGPENLALGIYSHIAGELGGEALFLFEEKNALKLSKYMSCDIAKVDDIDESCVKRIADVFIVPYLKSMQDMLDLKIEPTAAQHAYDMVQPIIDFLLIKIAKHSDEIFFVKEKIFIEKDEIEGVFLIIFEDEALRKILDTLKKKYGVL